MPASTTADGSPRHEGERIVDALTAWLSDAVGAPVSVSSARRTSYGYSRENWVFDATWDGEDHALIARRDPPGSVLVTDRELEVAVLRAMATTRVPVPTVRWVDLGGERLGRPSLVMDLCDGACDPFVLNGTRPPAERRELASHLYEHLAAIHMVDWRTVGLAHHLRDPGADAALVALDDWESQLRDVQLDPEPELTYVVEWLRARAPSSPRTVLVHGDFKPGNVLLLDGRVSAVLDWETAHLGDAHEDLGWVTNPFRAGEHRIAGEWEPDDLVRHWEAATGWEADRAAVRWWQVFANLKLGVILLRGMREFLDGRLDRTFPPPLRIVEVLLDQIEAVDA